MKLLNLTGIQGEPVRVLKNAIVAFFKNPMPKKDSDPETSVILLLNSSTLCVAEDVEEIEDQFNTLEFPGN
jgi:hypothetical protein